MNSTLTKSQTKAFGPKAITYYGSPAKIRVTVRYDDDCGNGHNTFAITAEIRQRGRLETCGCLHDEIQAYFPELAHLIKWHLCSSDGPMHYVANTAYWAAKGEYDSARHCAIWPEATLDDLADSKDLEAKLNRRLPALLVELKTAMESLGFTY